MDRTRNVTFYATLAQSKDVFWVMQPSNSISLNIVDDISSSINSSIESMTTMGRTQAINTAYSTKPTRKIATTTNSITTTVSITTTDVSIPDTGR